MKRGEMTVSASAEDRIVTPTTILKAQSPAEVCFRRDGPSCLALFRRLALVLPALFAVLATSNVAGELVFWNKLGSNAELTHSAVGPGGWVVNSGEAYEPAKFDGGFLRKQPGGYATAKFPGSVLHPLRERGTIELWIVPKVPNPVPYQYGIWALVGGPAAENGSASRGNVYLLWGDGVTGRGFFGGVQFDGMQARTPNEAQQFVATPGVPIHAAICWDINGIGGSADRVRVYRDGVIVGATSAAWNPSGTVYQDRFETGGAADSQSHDKYIVDNLKVWNVAKTDFSDRFGERGLVFWNKLGSTVEVETSEIGPGGEITGTGADFQPARFGNGFINTASTNIAAAQFPGSVLHERRERGAIELWIVPNGSSPQPFTHGIYAFVGDAAAEFWYMNRGNVYLIWGDTVTGRGFFGGVQFDGMHARTPDEPQQFVTSPGTPVHAAICWDINGIDGTTDKVRVYRDGAVVGATSAAWNPAGTVYQERFMTGHLAGTAPANRYISDNLKVWDYAKTDFSDRFQESTGGGIYHLSLTTPDSTCRNVDNPTLTINVDMLGGGSDIIAGQFFLTFDPNILHLTPANIGGVAPWTEVLLARVDNDAGTADIAVGISGGGGGGGSGRMATLVFDVVGDTCSATAAVAAFRANSPPTRLTDLDINDISGESGLLTTTALGPIVTDVHAPVISDPGDLSIECNPIAGLLIQDWKASVTASDFCGVTSFTEDSSGVLSPCPGTRVGVVVWTAVDACGNTSTLTRSLTVRDTLPPFFEHAVGGELAAIHSVADAGGCNATIAVPIPLVQQDVGDECDSASVVVNGVRSDAQPLDAPYPSGTTTITWTAVDCSLNSATATQDVLVDPVNEIEVAIEFGGVWTGGSVPRCIHFELFPTDCSDTLIIERDVQFAGRTGETFMLQVPCDSYSCITARDVKHSLRSTDADFAIVDRAYSATFTGAHALLLGNLYQSGDGYRYIDILDFAVLLARFGANVPAATPCGFAGRHADMTGDGVVNLTDLSIMLSNFGSVQGDNCCGLSNLIAGDQVGVSPPVAATLDLLVWLSADATWSLDSTGIAALKTGPITSITVAELIQQGEADLAAADLNHDGVVDLADVPSLAGSPGKLPRVKSADRVNAISPRR